MNKLMYLLIGMFISLIAIVIIISVHSEPEFDGLIFDESLSTGNLAVYHDGDKKIAVISGDYDKYRLDNGSLSDTNYSIGGDFKVEKSRFSVELGSKTPSINFTYKSDSLKFKFVGYGLYDPLDDDFWLSQDYNDIIPVVDGNKIYYNQIIENISVSYEINKTGANKLITFTNKSRDFLPPAFSNKTFIVFIEKIIGDYPKTNSSWGKMWFNDVFIPEADNVFKKIFNYQGEDYLLTALRFSIYNSSDFPFSIDPTFDASSGCGADGFCYGSWGDNSGSGDGYSSIIIIGSSSVSVGAGNCSSTAAVVASDCSWFVNVSDTFYVEVGSSISGGGRGRGGTDNGGLGVGTGGAASTAAGDRAGGGGGGAYGSGGTGGDKNQGTPGAGGSAYNTTVPADYGSLWPPWGGSGAGSGSESQAGGDGAAGVYIEADNISVNDINMDGEQPSGQTGQYEGSSGGGGAGMIILWSRRDLTMYGAITARGGRGQNGCSGCQIGWDGSTGGGGGGGWIEIHYANVHGLHVDGWPAESPSVPDSVIAGDGGLCLGGYPNDCTMGAMGTNGSVYISQFNIAPNFTALPINTSSTVGIDTILSANLSAQIPLKSPDDYIKECNFSVWSGSDYYVNNSNATWAKDFMFNYSFMPNTTDTYSWNVTCYDSDSPALNTLGDAQGVNTIPFTPLDATKPYWVEIVGPVNNSIQDSPNVTVYTQVRDSIALSFCWFDIVLNDGSASGATNNNASFDCDQNSSFSDVTTLDTSYYIYLYANDTSNNVNVSIPVNISFDSHKPYQVDIVSPVNDSTQSSSVDFEVQAFDSFSSMDDCWIDVVNLTGPSSGVVGHNVSFDCDDNNTLTDLALVSYDAFLYANDTVNNVNVSGPIYFSVIDDTSGPIIEALYPAEAKDYTTTVAGRDNISWRVTDNVAVDTCLLYVNNSDVVNTRIFDDTEADPSGNVTLCCTGCTNACPSAYGDFNVTIGYATVGSFNYTFNCNDSSDNLAEFSRYYTVTTPSPAGPSGGGGGGPSVEVIEKAYCGDHICQIEPTEDGYTENIFSCRLDCATLSRLTTGELFESGVVVQYLVYLIVILVLMVSIPTKQYKSMGRKIGKNFKFTSKSIGSFIDQKLRRREIL